MELYHRLGTERLDNHNGPKTLPVTELAGTSFLADNGPGNDSRAVSLRTPYPAESSEDMMLTMVGRGDR